VVYSIAELVGLPTGEYLEVSAINERGRVIGTSSTWRGFHRAVTWEMGNPVALEVPGAAKHTSAHGLNDDDVIVGRAEFSDRTIRGVVWRDGRASFIGTLGGHGSFAGDIDNAGVIVGGAENEVGDYHAFRLKDGEMIELPTIGLENHALVTNEKGAAAGTARMRPFVTRAVLWNKSGVVDMGALSGPDGSSYVRNLNDLEQAVGYSEVDRVNRAFLWEDGRMTDLGTLPDHHRAIAYGVNNAGDVVGYSADDGGPLVGVIWSEGRILPLLDRLAIRDVWTSLLPITINNAGQIAGTGWSDNGRSAFLATPIRCNRLRPLRVRCDERGMLKLKLKLRMPQNTVTHVSANGNDARTLFADERGRAKAKWSGQGGVVEICVDECAESCVVAECP